MVLIDLSGSNRAAKALNEEPIDGILGADILFPTSAIVDCQTQMLVLKMDPNLRGSVPGYDVHGLHHMPLHVSKSYNLYVDGQINGIPAKTDGRHRRVRYPGASRFHSPHEDSDARNAI